MITEVNDEDTLHARGSTQRSKVYEIFPIKQQSTEETDTGECDANQIGSICPGGESFEMIDDEAVSDGAMEDVVEIASTEDDQSQTSENDKVLELRSLVLTPTSSEVISIVLFLLKRRILAFPSAAESASSGFRDTNNGDSSSFSSTGSAAPGRRKRRRR